MATAHKNRGIESSLKEKDDRALIIVLKKLIDPKMDLIPARCKLKIAISTETPEWYLESDKGGYTVQPVPAPESIREDNNNKVNDGIKSQNERLFIRGNTMSTQPNIIGISQLPNPPIATGITIKKIIINACAVTITL